MKILLVILMLLAFPKEAIAQKNEWVTELDGGAMADIFARGPWINPSWRHSLIGRVSIATGLSVIYEHIIEPWNNQSKAGRTTDVNKRLVGTITTELLWAIGKKIL